MTAGGRVTIDRAEFDEITLDLAALAYFVDKVYCGDTMDSMAWSELWKIWTRLREAAGLPWMLELDDENERRHDEESAREKALIAEYVAATFPEAVAS